MNQTPEAERDAEFEKWFGTSANTTPQFLALQYWVTEAWNAAWQAARAIPQAAAEPVGRGSKQLAQWLMRNPDGLKLVFAGPPETFGLGLSQVRMMAEDGSEWTLIGGVREGYKTGAERNSNLLRIVRDELAAPDRAPSTDSELCGCGKSPGWCGANDCPDDPPSIDSATSPGSEAGIPASDSASGGYVLTGMLGSSNNTEPARMICRQCKTVLSGDNAAECAEMWDFNQPTAAEREFDTGCPVENGRRFLQLIAERDAARYRWLIEQIPCSIADDLECGIGEIGEQIDEGIERLQEARQSAIAAMKGER